MDTDHKPIVVVSRCIEFDHCRYNGQMIPDPFVARLSDFVDFIPVCPEVEIGLGVPRDPIRIVEADGGLMLYQPATGRDLTESMRSFTSLFLDSLTAVDGFILKFRSPSCGPGQVKIYKGMDPKGGAGIGSGFFAAAVLKRFGGLPVEDEGRLKNFSIREYFLTHLFCRAAFRRIEKEGSMRALVDFHTRYKYQFMALNQSRLKILGKIVANHEKLPPGEVFISYGRELGRMFAALPRPGRTVNMLLHAFGGVSRHLTENERELFLQTIEEYRDERIPLSVPIRLINSWAVRFEDEFLLNQAFLSPYPQALVSVSDSGKGRELS
ncbi:MAG: DUF523 and DUF1722 domain-containing protein [Deltaproteobacteria bacterium]|nr:DUF523 and DUF1722 domain-containing protein [Candidatus Zymogenaceae bacterium]